MREIDFTLASQERGNQEVFWRRERESNPRYTFVGIHTISSRAPSAARTSLHRSVWSIWTWIYFNLPDRQEQIK